MLHCGTQSRELFDHHLAVKPRDATVRTREGDSSDRGRCTLFLDEIGELSLAHQLRLLHFLQEQRTEPGSEGRTSRRDLRLIVSSCRDLAAEVAAHRFREDLFFRLGVITVHLPALRERPKDIVPLARRMIEGIGSRHGRPSVDLSPEVEAMLTRHPWPGNVRELHNAIEQALTVCGENLIAPQHLPDSVRRSLPGSLQGLPSLASLREVERAHTLRVIAESPTLEVAAATLGIDVTTLWRRRKRYQLD